jgi:deoxyribose-phosphate aldolase
VSIATANTPWTPNAIVGLCDHAILHPALTDADLRDQLKALRAYPVATVCIKPYAVATAVEVLSGTNIGVGTVIGFPHGSSVPEIKAEEAERAFRDGARDVDMVVNVGKALSHDWDYIHQDVRAVLDVTRKYNGVIKVIFETDLITDDTVKIDLCRICSELAVDFIKTSTGFGFVKRADGNYNYQGATEHDIALMKRHSSPGMGIKPSGGIRSLDDVLKYVALGATRIGTASTFAIHAEATARFGGAAKSSIDVSIAY